MVPQHLRTRIWATYRRGQCDDWQPSAAYCDAAMEAVKAVAAKEGLEPDVRLYEMFRPDDQTEQAQLF